MVAAAVPGFASAIVTRVLMRAVAILTNDETDFNADALLFIGFVYTVALLPGCLALAYSRAGWPWLLVAAGTAFLALAAVGIGLDETSDATGMTAAQRVGLALVLIAMLATYAAQVLFAVRWARRPSHQQRSPASNRATPHLRPGRCPSYRFAGASERCFSSHRPRPS